MKLLIEIGVEELPAIPLLKAYKQFDSIWSKILDENSINSKCEFFYTPRRLVIYSDEFATTQEDKEIEMIGAPKDIAYKDGKLTKAGESFLKKAGISEDEVEFKSINNKEVMYYKKLQKGKDSSEILPDIINRFLKELNFGRSMRWGSNKFEFIRPIRNLICVLGDKSIEFEAYGVKSDMKFFSHRDIGFKKISFNSIEDYFDKLSKNGVILDQNKRKDKILSDIKEIEKKSDLSVQIDSDLLDEIVAITEYPNAILGDFDEEFLSLPQEVIITSMKENQRYFGVFNKGKLSNHFVVISNSMSKDKLLIKKGNEKVLKARLADGMFFYENDLKSEFDGQKLKDILYMKELGSIFDKELRELSVMQTLYGKFFDRLLDEIPQDILEDSITDTIILSKADLSSSMVTEFPELQGIMGGYYARAKNYNDFVVSAIKEQYLPNGDDMPSSLFSALINISIKIETLMSLFSIDKIPTGTKDPYALRRNAIGLIKIIMDKNLDFDLKELIDELMVEYKKFDSNLLMNFIKDRLYSDDINPSVTKACIMGGSNNIFRIKNNITALNQIVNQENFKDNFDTFKRLSNIIKDNKISIVDENLLQLDDEKTLNNEFKNLLLDINKPKEYLNNLFGLKEKIDKFFDNVMINVDDNSIKQNRINVVGQIYNAFLKIADIKEISL